MEKEIYTKSTVLNGFTSATISSATTTYGDWIDTAGYNSILYSLSAVFTTGQINAVVFQEANKSDYSDAATVVAGNTLFSPDKYPILATGFFQAATVSKKRYVRIGITSAAYGGSTNFTLVSHCILSDAFAQPYNGANTLETLASINAPGAIADSTVTFPKL